MDSVRGLALLPGVGAVSGSHDFTLRVWTLDGVTVSELIGHTSLVFQVACSAAGLIGTPHLATSASHRTALACRPRLGSRATSCVWPRSRSIRQ